MKKILPIGILVLVVGIGWYAFTMRGTCRGGEEPSLTYGAAHFLETVQARVISEIGQPIEGFEPFMVMQVYPGFVASDFDCVEGEQGAYKAEGDQIIFVANARDPQHSAARAITSYGMGKLLENTAQRLGMPLTTREEVDAILNVVLSINDNPWKVFRDEQQGITFEYPEELVAQYVRLQIWPPQVVVLPGNFECREVQSEAGGFPKAERRLVDDREYCVYSRSEGAAGSIYVDYVYTTAREGKLMTASFSLRYPQCGNYPNPEKGACEYERETFDLDGLIDRIVQTLKVTS